MKTIYPIEHTASKKYGQIYKEKHDINGNPQYIVSSLLLFPGLNDTFIISDKQRRKAGFKIINRDFQSFIKFSTYGDIEKHIEWMIEVITKEKAEQKRKDEIDSIRYLIGKSNNIYEVIDTLDSRDFPDIHSLTQEKKRLRLEYIQCYTTYNDITWRVLSNLPARLKKEIKEEIEQNNK